MKAIGWALIVVGVGWLGLMSLFVLSGLHAGKVQDTPAAILGIGIFGGVPALLMWAVAGVVFARARGDAREMAVIELQQQVLEAVQTEGKCNLDELAQRLGAKPAQVEAAVHDLVGKRLFTGYVNWRGREIFSAEAEKLSGGTCPNCGGQFELAGKSLARCPHCGTEVFLPTSVEATNAQRPS